VRAARHLPAAKPTLPRVVWSRRRSWKGERVVLKLAVAGRPFSNFVLRHRFGVIYLQHEKANFRTCPKTIWGIFKDIASV
jgi:hypothetical protein